MRLKLPLFLFLSILLFPVQAQEFRGVWISTVFNTDWPSKAGLSTEQQKAELIQQLDVHEKNGINAIIFQVRTTSDALYQSSIEPWSQWLSGVQGKAPEPFYDPLEFVIEEAHKRGMELHAWLNPYRAEINVARKASTSDQVSQKHPEWCIAYGIRNYLDPGIPEVRKYILSVVNDIISRYDVDGIHFDDYFYPYKVNGKEFNDHASFKKYGGAFSNKADWRRDNVNKVVQELHEAIKAHDPNLKFGISPFGIWRNKRDHPEGSSTTGMTNYHGLYADVRYWMQQAWLDYVVPQLYWPIGDKAADFVELTNWWNDNAYGRHVYIGLGLYNSKTNSPKAGWRDRFQIDKQISYLRGKRNIKGMCFFTSSSFSDNPMGINDRLQKDFFSNLAQTPEMPWKNPPVAVIDVEPPVNKDSVVEDIEVIQKDSVIFPPENFRIVRNKSQVLFAWDVPKKIKTKGLKYTIYRFESKNINDISQGTVYANVVRNKILIKRKRFVLFRKKYFFTVIAQKDGIISEMSNVAKMKFKKGELGPIDKPSIVVY